MGYSIEVYDESFKHIEKIYDDLDSEAAGKILAGFSEDEMRSVIVMEVSDEMGCVPVSSKTLRRI